jgi:hypothetical protein
VLLDDADFHGRFAVFAAKNKVGVESLQVWFHVGRRLKPECLQFQLLHRQFIARKVFEETGRYFRPRKNLCKQQIVRLGVRFFLHSKVCLGKCKTTRRHTHDAAASFL